MSSAIIRVFGQATVPYHHHKAKNGGLAFVGADLLRVVEALRDNARRLADLIGLPSLPITNHEVQLVFSSWITTYLAADKAKAADHLYAVDMDRKDGDYFGHAEVGGNVTVKLLRLNLKWYTASQFQALVDADRARINLHPEEAAEVQPDCVGSL